MRPQYLDGSGPMRGLHSANRNLLPLWLAGDWTSVCITADTEAGGGYRVNINGQIVLQTKNREAVFKTHKEGFIILQVFTKGNRIQK